MLLAVDVRDHEPAAPAALDLAEFARALVLRETALQQHLAAVLELARHLLEGALLHVRLVLLQRDGRRAAGRVVHALHLQPVDDALDERHDGLRRDDAAAACGARRTRAEPRRDADATEDVAAGTLDGRVEHALADAAHEVRVGRRLEQIDVVARHRLAATALQSAGQNATVKNSTGYGMTWLPRHHSCSQHVYHRDV